MIISHGRRYVFVHIPKTGGTSMALALEDRAMKDDLLIGDTPKAKRRKGRLKALTPHGRLWKHATLTDIDGVLDPQTLVDFFTFTMVRNPWDRVVSYYHWLRVQSFSHPAVELARSVDFATFVQSRVTQDSLRANPASAYMRCADGAIRCNAYIRLEHFEQDAEPLFAHLGFRFDLPLANASERAGDYGDYYTSALRDIIADCCATDIKQFGYRFEG